MKHLSMGIRVTAALALGSVLSTGVEAQTYFGEDLNGSPSVRLAAFPNATNARNTFLTMLSGVGTESFEGIAGGTSGPFNLTFPGAGTAVLTGDVQVRTVAAGSDNGRYPTAGTNFLRAAFGPTSFDNFRIDFTAPIAAFGFFGTDIGDFGSQLMLTFIRAGGGNTVINVPHTLGAGGGNPADGAALFFGLIDAANPFTAIEFSAGRLGSSNDVFGFDQMTIGSVEQIVKDPTVVPEPATVITMATGLLMLVAAGRRRQRRTPIDG